MRRQPRRSAVASKRGGGGIVGMLFKANRLFSVLREHIDRGNARQDFGQFEQLADLNVRSGRLASSSLGATDDLEDLGMFAAEGEEGGFYVGMDGERPVFYRGAQHALITAPSSMGKSWSIAAVLATSTALGAAPASVLFLDIKGQGYWGTSAGRRTIDGIEPAVFAPWRSYGLDTVKLNVLGDLVDTANAGQRVKDRAVAKVDMIFGDSSKKGPNAWVTEDAKMIILIIIVHYAELEPEKCNLPALADVAALSIHCFVKLMDLLRQSPAGEGFVSMWANKYFETYRKTDDDVMRRQYSWITQEMATAFQLYSPGSVLRDVTQETTFDVGLLKRRPQAMYCIWPSLYVDSHSRFAALLMDYVIETIARANGPIRTNFILDELSNFAPVSCLPRALRLYRSEGIRIVGITQDRQALSRYGPDFYKTFEANAISLTWGCRDASHAADIEARAGQRIEQVPSYSMSISSGGKSGTKSVGERLTHNLNRHEVMLIGDGHLILEMPGQKVQVLDRPFWPDIPFVRPYIRDLRTDPPPPVDHD